MKVDTEKLRKDLENKLLSKPKPICKNCKGEMRLVKTKNLVYRCKWLHCRHEESIFLNTIFHKSRLGLELVVEILRLFSEGVSFLTIKRLVGISKTTLMRYLEYFRSKIILHHRVELVKIGGPGIIVEIDESKFGKRKYHRGHSVEGVWVLGMVERTPERKVVFIAIEKRDKNTLHKLINKHVIKGSLVYTDGWRGYYGLDEYGYKHFSVNHSLNFVDPVSGVHTNTIEGNWSPLKRFVPVRCRTKRKIIFYLTCWMLRRNNTTNMFFTLLNMIF